MKRSRPAGKRQTKVTKARLEITADARRIADTLAVSFCLTAPRHRDVWTYDGPAEYIIDWGLEPGVCTPFETSLPLVRFYQAETEMVPGLSINGYQIPPIRRIKGGTKYQGTFSIGTSITRVDAGPQGEAVLVQIPLPPNYRVQMTVGYNFRPLKINPTEMTPQKTVLSWQRALDSNVLVIQRT